MSSRTARTIPAAAALLSALLTAPCCLAQGETGAPAAPPTAKILSREVDGLIRSLRGTADDDGGLGDGSCLETAMVLTAAGHSHRFYHLGDGPWLRQAVDSLFVHRRADGAFADGSGDDGVDATRWVLNALEVLAADRYGDELAAGRSFLAAHGAPVSPPFDDEARALMQRIAGSPDRIAALEEAARSMVDVQGASGAAASPRELVGLVCCQAIARGDFDDAIRTQPEPSAAAASWSPTQEQGFAFLLGQQEDGVFGVEHGGQRYPDVGLTGIGLAALQTKPGELRTGDEIETIERGLTWLLGTQNDDGSFGQTNVNYSTCAAVMALAAAGEPRFEDPLQRAQDYILLIQNVEQRQYGPGDRDYGSIGYGGDERGDLSNLQFALEALSSTGLEQENEAFAKALVFLQRTQNLRGYNDFTGRTRSSEDGSWYQVAPGDDGGSAYYPGNSPAGYVELPGGTRIPRSYGSMTYALLKAYTLCGLTAEDPRVRAAVQWIERHWALGTNPGVDPALGEAAAYQGLYYYYMVMAQALDTAGIDALHPPAEPGGERGTTIDWRTALRSYLAAVQRPDGSWLNEQNGRWWEDQPLVCSVYSMLALQRCDEARSTTQR